MLSRLIFLVGMDMLSTRRELMQRRLFFTWMVYAPNSLSLSMYMHITKSMFYLVLLLLVLQGQIDGCITRVRFTLTQRQKASSPIKVVPAAPKKEAPPKDKVGPPVEKDAPPQPRESEFLQLKDFLS